MRRYVAVVAVLSVVGIACGEDKDYGEPLDDPNATASATAAVSNAGLLTVDTTDETALNALNGLSANYNLMAGAKLQAQQAQAPGPRPLGLDPVCVIQTATSISFSECDWAGNIVNGEVNRAGSEIDIDLNFFRSDTDTTTEIDVDGSMDITAAAMTGFVNFDIAMSGDGFSVDSGLDGAFDVVLADGCAVGGTLEVHGTASTRGQSQSVWVMAEFGPACGDVVVR